ncbi:MAG: hypothetical protein GX552_02250 [Chloroflexi bacterium]|nr:hypothetical protein [Chloroflexota bacterium]
MRHRFAWILLLAMVMVACEAQEATPTWTRAPALGERSSGIGAEPEEPTTVTPTPTPLLPTPTPYPALVLTLLPTATPFPTPTPLSIPSPTPVAVPSATPWQFASPQEIGGQTPAETPELVAAQPTGTPPDLAALPGNAWNMELVGHVLLEPAGWYGGLAIKDNCAYVGAYSPAAVTLVDISDPTRPTTLRTLPLEPGSRPVEVRAIPDLNLLVVADLGHHRLLTYDITDCAQPNPLGMIELPGAPHEFYLWRDGERVLAYAATFDDAPPSLVVVDLSDPAAPVEVGRWSAAQEGLTGRLHSLSVSEDGSRAYLALWNGGFAVLEVDLQRLEVVRDEAGRVDPADVPNVHSAVPLADERYVLLAVELYDCPFGWLVATDIAQPSRPQVVASFRLPENRCGNLPPGAIFSVHNPLVVQDLVFASWYAAGVQVVDFSDPRSPERVGQFVPEGAGAAPRGVLGAYPVQTFSYPILRDGLFYVVDSQTGLYVLRYTGPRAEEIANSGHVEGNVTAMMSSSTIVR